MFAFPFWGSSWLISLEFEILGCFLFHITSWFEAGRPKLILATLSLMVCAVGASGILLDGVYMDTNRLAQT